MNRRQKIGRILAADIVAGTGDLNSADIWIDQFRFFAKVQAGNSSACQRGDDALPRAVIRPNAPALTVVGQAV